jgi:hypothetical protein
MPREPKAYRDNLEDILKFSGGKRILTIKEVSTYTGKCYRWVKEKYGISKDGISAPTLARLLSESF